MTDVAAQMDDILPSLGGSLPVGCPEYIEQPCYVPCQHVEETLAEYYNYENYSNKPRHNSIIVGFLELQEYYINSLCNLSLDVCVRGALMGFPCVQCIIIQRGFKPCKQFLDCDEYEVIDPCYNTNICNSNFCASECKKGEFDFQSTPESQEIYELIVSALNGSYTANVAGVDLFLSKIWNNASVVSFVNDIMYIDLGKTPTDLEIRIWYVIEKIMPLPFGVEAKLVMETN